MRQVKRLIVLTNWGTEKTFWPITGALIRHLPTFVTSDDVLLLEGGSDISPQIYGQRTGSKTHPGSVQRDKMEIEAFRKIQAAGGSVIGICRGAQLATALLGAPLIQHVDGHETGEHAITTDTGNTIVATSAHHQMMYPFDLDKNDYRLLAWSTKNQSSRYLDEYSRDISAALPEGFVEPEVVWYPKIRTLAIQGHPEYLDNKDDFPLYCSSLAKELIINV